MSDLAEYADDPLPVRLGDGNAFAVLGACSRAWRNAGRPTADLDAFRREAMSGDYDHLLRTVMHYFVVEAGA